tara:strand:- start:211 stop:366 length:156 start_codon:yes stop_codon:yes gene_type:complete
MNDNLKKLFRSASRKNRKFVSEILNQRKESNNQTIKITDLMNKKGKKNVNT